MRRINKLFYNTIRNINISNLLNTTTIQRSFNTSTYFSSSSFSTNATSDPSISSSSKENQEGEEDLEKAIDDFEFDDEIDMADFVDFELKDAEFDAPHPPKYRYREVNEHDQSHGVGRRKTAVARVWLRPGVGQVKVNHQDISDYFDNGARVHALQAFQVTETAGLFDAWCLVNGGGKMGKKFIVVIPKLENMNNSVSIDMK